MEGPAGRSEAAPRPPLPRPGPVGSSLQAGVRGELHLKHLLLGCVYVCARVYNRLSHCNRYREKKCVHFKILIRLTARGAQSSKPSTWHRPSPSEARRTYGHGRGSGPLRAGRCGPSAEGGAATTTTKHLYVCAESRLTPPSPQKMGHTPYRQKDVSEEVAHSRGKGG